ncbi:iron-sulfur cluster biosynthesis family protein [Evansella tamaricis]|uniref:Iron-sulfur cluster biosynthesis family protein n=1 Tax=Evansella tamaricis TaxID=2069301 RepID=A0ABS6JI81_9BACI|nr:iron-sulfur cluster biosynthesis family protein [Evansella tamaricis]MBU9713338.1 iron-sulfur cluster biosynthesis family protein [Evansella tamaricis]
MKVTITDNAWNNLIQHSSTIVDNYVYINYDFEGCGCVVSGVNQLMEKDSFDAGDALAEMQGGNGKVSYAKQYDWVYDEEVTIDFSESSNTFQLKSPNQMLTPRMKFIPMNRGK